MSTQENIILNRDRKIAYFAIAMAFLSWMAVKLPMPALPTLAHYFHTGGQVFKVSVTLNLLSFSVSPIIWGPLSNRYGRKAMLCYAYILAIIGTLFAMLAVNIEMYLLGRVLEGFAVGSIAPLGRAILADKLDKITMARAYAKVAVAALLPPAVGPVIGGYILVYLGWRYIFMFFLLLAIAYLFMVIKYFDNTNVPDSSQKILSQVKSNIAFISSSDSFWRYVLTYALINGFMISYYAAMPYWFVVHFKMAEQVYAWLAFLPIITYIVGSMITSRLLNYFSMDDLLLFGMIFAVIIAVSILCISYWVSPSILLINIFMCCFSVASGIVTPMTNASLLHAFRDKATELSVLVSGIRVGGAGLLVLITSNISLDTFWELGWYSFVLSSLGLVLNIYFTKRKPG